MKKTRWTKEEFFEIVKPCGYKVRIWWWFVRHEYVTSLDVLNAEGVDDDARVYVLRMLERRYWAWEGKGHQKEYWKTLLADIRTELEAS